MPIQVLEGPMLPELYAEPVSRKEKIAEAVKELQHFPQREMPVTHHFAPGVYSREIAMPAGTLVVGHIHKTKHFNIVLSGVADVVMGEEKRRVQAGDVFVSEAGVQKVLIIVEDCRWLTVHANPQDETDIVKIEESLVEIDASVLADKKSLTLDEYRMKLGGVETSNPRKVDDHSK